MSVRFQERPKARGSSPRTAPGFFVSASTKKRPEGRFFSMRYNTAETLDALEHQRGISAAEAEVVLDGSADFHLLRLVLADIDAAFRILVDDVDRRRRHLVANRKNRKDAFDTAGTAEQVTRSALGGAHHKLVGVFAEEFAHSAGFVDIAHRSRRTVRIEVVDILRL